ncbi:MAG: DNA-binding transcriptional regulator Fis [bacterium]
MSPANLDDSSETSSSPQLHCSSETVRLSEAVLNAIEQYFETLDGHECTNLYELVISEVERPLLKCVLHNCKGNQSRAAVMLGISRGNLRKKLNKYDLLGK